MKTWIAMVPFTVLTPASEPIWCGDAHRHDAGTSLGAP
jgi:hypothetical protein